MKLNNYLLIKQAKLKGIHNYEEVSIDDIPEVDFRNSSIYERGYGRDEYIRKPDKYDLSRSWLDQMGSPYFPNIHSGRAMLAGFLGGGGLGYLASRWLNNKLGLSNPQGAGGKLLKFLVNMGGTSLGSVGGLMAGSVLNQIYNNNRFNNGRLYEIDQERKAKGLPSISKEEF